MLYYQKHLPWQHANKRTHNAHGGLPVYGTLRHAFVCKPLHPPHLFLCPKYPQTFVVELNVNNAKNQHLLAAQGSEGAQAVYEVHKKRPRWKEVLWKTILCHAHWWQLLFPQVPNMVSPGHCKELLLSWAISCSIALLEQKNFPHLHWFFSFGSAV